jgi:hypothetical protein
MVASVISWRSKEWKNAARGAYQNAAGRYPPDDLRVFLPIFQCIHPSKDSQPAYFHYNDE